LGKIGHFSHLISFFGQYLVAQAEDVANLDKEDYSNILSECGLAVALTVSLNCLTSTVAVKSMILPRYHAERFHEIASACANQCNICRQSGWLFIIEYEDFFQIYSFIEQIEWTNHYNWGEKAPSTGSETLTKPSHSSKEQSAPKERLTGSSLQQSATPGQSSTTDVAALLKQIPEGAKIPY